MKLVVDDKIPFIREALTAIADTVLYVPGAQIDACTVRDADALIVRTRTRCNRALLEGSRVRFIATATIGFDHLDTDYLREAGIAWKNCPGCNATSVGQYVRSCLILLKREKGLDFRKMTMGIVGVGHVGTQVLAVAREMGIRCLLCDPPRQLREGGDFVSLQTLADECDLITFHVPLVLAQPFPTLHLADATFFRSLKHRPVLINTSRGEVVDNAALLAALNGGQVREAIIDTWENEPCINLDLLNKVYLGTPHIAGYSADGKANATRMALGALCRHFGLPCLFRIVPPMLPANLVPAADAEERALQLYNPHRDSDALKSHPEHFEALRGNYPLRREMF